MLLLFDGVCNLCNGAVQWIIVRDKKAIFQFAALQSDAGQRALNHLGLPTQTFNSIVLIKGDRYLIRSDAALEIAVQLGGFWQLAGIFKIVPRFIRDAVYDFIANNRYRWFGKQEQCMLPRAEWKGRFL
jgi:predicted DCC family thiol-disulfide oxidoreductase YuxK